MKIALGCDHGGYELKQYIIQVLEKLGHTCEPGPWRRDDATGGS